MVGPENFDSGNSKRSPVGAGQVASCLSRNIPRKGSDRQGGSLETLPVHNFSNEVANGPCLVLIGIGGGFALPFSFIAFHSSPDSPRSQ